MNIAAQFETLPPHNLDAERAVIASAVIDAVAWRECRGVVGVDSFYSEDHQIIWGAVDDLYRAKKPVDAVILRGELKRRGLFEEIGGHDGLVAIIGSAFTSAYGMHYAREVREHATRREVIALANDALRSAYGSSKGGESATMAAGYAAKFARLASTGSADRIHSIGDAVDDVLGRRTSGEVRRVSTGLASLDAVIGGLGFGQKHIVGGQPGMGKSAGLKQIARNVAGRSIPVGIVSVEEHRHKIAENLLANESGVPNNRIAFDTVAAEEWGEVESAADVLRPLPLYVVDAARRLSEIVAAATRLVHEHGCQVVMVDHLHIIDGECDENREREISKISGELKWVWKDLNVAGVEAAQLNRKDGRDRPSLGSLRDSGSLGQDGDVVIFLHREDYHRRKEPGYTPDGVIEFIVAKNKSGAQGTVPLHFDEARQRITDLEPAVSEFPDGAFDEPRGRGGRAA